MLWGDETSLYKPQLEDGLPARLGDAFMELAERKEYDDAMPSMTKTAAGIWLGYRDHLAALSILQLDRTAIALARGDADAAVWLLCDHYYLGLQMASEDLMCHVDDLLTAPNQAARDYGRRGGALRHERTNALKAWALREAASMKSADIEMARTLAQQIPSSMLNASRDPERLIYEALRNRRNQGGLDGS